MGIRYNERVLLAEIESVYNSDPTPTEGANAMLAFEVEINPDAGDNRPRDYVKPTPGNVRMDRVLEHVTIAFSVELQGAGAAGTAPAYGPLLRACGFDEAVNAGVDVTYTLIDPNDPDLESVTVYYHSNDALHAVTGCRGDVELIVEPNQIPLLRFSLMGFRVSPTTASVPTPTLTAWIDGLFATAVNTTFALHGVSSVLRSLRLGPGNAVVHRDYVGLAEMQITDRNPAGSLVIEAPLIDDQDWFGAAEAMTLGTLALVHGTSAGSIVEVNAPKVQLLSPQYQDQDNVKHLAADLNIAEDAGNDELEIVVR